MRIKVVVAIVTCALAVAGLTTAYILLPMGEELAQPTPEADYTATYNATSEELRLTVTQSEYAPQGVGKPAVIRVLWMDVGSESADTRRVPTTLRAGNATTTKGLWYARNGSGVVASPPESGQPVVITGDPTDHDNDSHAGPEPGDRFWVTIATTTGAGTRMGDVSINESGACINPEGAWQSEC
jgi:hypothetical protein